MEKRDYIIDEIEKVAELVAAFMAGRRVKQEAVNKALSDLTGLDLTFFAEADIATLSLISKLIEDDDKKALFAQLLLLKNSQTQQN